ncbi:hypothetical protein EDC53_104194 [Phytobacter diazotrophicus]|nr:hypothetical protein EDC53_104194 [Phytobacter diazotrophicus]
MELGEETAKVHAHNQPYHEFQGNLSLRILALLAESSIDKSA